MRIVIVTNGNFFARLILARLFRERAKDIAGIVVITGIKAGKSRFKSLLEITRRAGLRHLAYKASTYIVFAIANLLYPRRAFFVPNLAKNFSRPVIYASQVNDRDVVDQVKEWKPDLLVSVSCPQLIQAELLDVPRICPINIHSSLLPSYSGLSPYFWVLANGEKSTGTTVHIMGKGFDSGKILIQQEADISRNETVFSLFMKLSNLGSDALAESVSGIANCEPKEQDLSEISYFSWPTLSAVKSLYRNGHRFVKFHDYVQAIKWDFDLETDVATYRGEMPLK